MKGQKIVIVFFISALALCVDECKSSSIPMFEFLSRDEKVRKFLLKNCHMRKINENAN